MPTTTTRYWAKGELGSPVAVLFRRAANADVPGAPWPDDVWSQGEWKHTWAIARLMLGDPQLGFDLEEITEGQAEAYWPEAFR